MLSASTMLPVDAHRTTNTEVLTWQSRRQRTSHSPFERTSKRRHGFPSETYVKRGNRSVHGETELIEKLGREDLCTCGSGRRFQEILSANGALRWGAAERLL